MYAVVDSSLFAFTPKGGKRTFFDGGATRTLSYENVIRLFTEYIKPNRLSGEERKN
jgi:hypothetical protein